jgi:hypothetical protein
MPITWRLLRDHYGTPYSSDTRWVAISGDLEIGAVGREVLSNSQFRFAWHASFEPGQRNGWADTPEEAKAALEQAWFAWVKKAGLKDDPGAKPMEPPMTGPSRG